MDDFDKMREEQRQTGVQLQGPPVASGTRQGPPTAAGVNYMKPGNVLGKQAPKRQATRARSSGNIGAIVAQMRDLRSQLSSLKPPPAAPARPDRRRPINADIFPDAARRREEGDYRF